MNRKLNFAVCAAILAALIYSCSGPTDPKNAAPLSQERIVAWTAPGPLNVLLNGYQVHYDGRSYDGFTDQTTFSYTVSGTGVSPALSHFLIEIPECDPPMVVVSSDPANSVTGLDPSTGVSGVKWDGSLGTGETRAYSLTLDGNVSEGTTRAVVKGGNQFEAGDIGGPDCVFDISGTVFVDADEDTQLDSTESGIANVTVVLKLSGVVLTSVSTDANGDYLFADHTAGSYVVEINSVTSDPGDFNEQLFDAFTGDTALAVTIGPDSPDNNFGFVTNAAKIILDLETGELQATGESVKFWQKQVRSALHGGNGNAVYTPEEMLGFLNAINELFLEEPYQFEVDPDPSVGFREALALLSNPIRTDLELLQTELLATEFNEVSGRVILNAQDLQSVLISWGEALVADALGLPAGPQKTATIRDAAAVFEMLNESSGGGTSGG